MAGPGTVLDVEPLDTEITLMALKIGDIVAVEFADHVEDGSRPIRFVVYGRLEGLSRQELVVDSWEYKNRRLKHDSNEKRWVIVRSAIYKVVKLVPAEA